ncbi:guanylate kinase [Desulfuribacillus alkaliarsenatis]|uniref:Guanylate kinase n=1 Tax=Desulfuribacillus alkaliarsenatis TaxID=766136 RepID=A0A1E5G5B0_9FIRM|nr:guanylate kinase [Desulfuribacillus alkaliarsenatis]OEF98371.1 guanylate kinase [Desulfuribacillus alkaliarsenatis]
MKVLLVRPPRIKQAITLGEFMYSEPIGLEIIYSMLESQHQVEILDMMAEQVDIVDKLIEYKPQVVGITTLCIDVPMVIELAKKVKAHNPNIVTIIGGTQTFLNPQGFFTDVVDHVMEFTTSENLTKLLQYLEKNNRAPDINDKVPMIDGIRSRSNEFQSTRKLGRNEYIHPNRKSTRKYRHNYSYFGYKQSAIMATAQGCSKVCRFCLRWRIEGHVEEYFPMDFVIEEIKDIDESTIMIIDNDFLHNGKRILELCERLEQEHIQKSFICYASVQSILQNKEAVRRFQNNGLKAVLVGYETFKNEELATYQKKSTMEENLLASKFLKSIKLDVWASFMIHPNWDSKDFKAFRKYIKQLSPETISLSPLTPFPNLPLYQEYQDRLLYDKDDFEKWSFGQVIIKPSKMSINRYYYELLKTNIYVNTSIRNVVYMIRKFGLLTLFRLLKGSSKLFVRYVKLMLASGDIQKGKGHIFILSGYSGAGKNTIINHINKNNCSLEYIPSVTTRAIRPEESQGNPYYFISEKEFHERVANNSFIEYEEIHGNYYGTIKSIYEQKLSNGCNIIKDIDVNGALKFRQVFGQQVTLLFIQPSDISVLIERLKKRGDNAKDIKTRMNRIEYESQQKPHFDYIITNDNIDEAIEKVLTIIDNVLDNK